MLERLMLAYMMSMNYDVRSPMLHLVGPPGCGKSSVVEQLADLLGNDLHIINVSRLSPLDVEGVQMPHGHGDEMVLRMLPATFWTSLHEGDILLMDEFLRGFPEVYNALLDIFTSRRAGAFRLPKVFIIGASNSVTTYDQALEDRLLHIKVPDPRKSKTEFQKIASILVDELGLMPSMKQSTEMAELLDTEVLPTYKLLDSFNRKGVKSGGIRMEGTSVRNLIGQAQMRTIQSGSLKQLLDANNAAAMGKQQWQYVLLYRVDGSTPTYARHAQDLVGNRRLTPVQDLNIRMNLELIALEQVKKEADDGVG